MAIGTPMFIGSNGNTGTGSTVVLTTTGGVTAGDSIIVLVYVASLTVTVASVTDSAGNTYAVDVSRLHSTAARRVAIASCHNAAALASGGTITATMSASTSGAKVIDALTVSGLAASSTLDKTSGNDGTSTTWSTASTGTLAQADELAVAGAVSESTTASTPDAGWTEVDDRTVALNRRLVMQQQIVSATTALNAGGTWGNAVWVGIIATYKAAAGAVTIAADTAPATASGDTVTVRAATTIPADTASAAAVGDPVGLGAQTVPADSGAATASGDAVGVSSGATVGAGPGGATAGGTPVSATTAAACYEVRLTPLILGVPGEEESDLATPGVVPVELASTTLLTQYSNVEVPNVQLNEFRTGRVVVSIHDPVVAALEPFAQALWIAYKRPADTVAEALVYGPCNVITDYAAETVTLEVQDPSQRCQHHYIRRGDDALNLDNNRGRLRTTAESISTILDAARNTPEQQDRDVPALGLRFFKYGLFPDEATAPFIEFERGQECWDLISQITRSVTGPDIDMTARESFPASYYAELDCWDPPTDPEGPPPEEELGRNLDPADPDDPQPGEVIFDFGLGLDNLTGLVETPGRPTTHCHVVDADKTYRITSADADSSAAVGVWVDWVEADFKIPRPTQTTPADTNPLKELARARVKAYGVPPKFFTCTLRPDDVQPYHFGHKYWASGSTVGDFYLGDYVRVRAGRGYRSFSTLARITAVKFSYDVAEDLPRLEVTMIPAIGGSAGDDPQDA